MLGRAGHTTSGGRILKAVVCTDFGCSPTFLLFVVEGLSQCSAVCVGAVQPAVMLLLLLLQLQRRVDHMLVSSGRGPHSAPGDQICKYCSAVSFVKLCIEN